MNRRWFCCCCATAIAIAAAAGVSMNVAAADDEQPPAQWSSRASLSSGADSNPLRDPSSSTSGALIRIDGALEFETPRNMRMTTNGWYEQSLSRSDAGQGHVQLVGAYRRRIRPRWWLKVVSLSAVRRDQTVFADGQILTNGAVTLTETSQHLYAGGSHELGKFDIDTGAQTNINFTGGNLERYLLFGLRGSAAVRYVPTAKLSLRLHYSYEFQWIDGLTPRNLAGAAVRASRKLQIGIHSIRTTARYHRSPRISLALGYTYTRIADGFSGYYDGGQHKLRALATLAPTRRWRVEASTEFAHRGYPFRQASPNNQDSDTEIEVVIEATRRLGRRLGLVLRYQLGNVAASPFGTLYSRHVFLVGVSGRMAWARRRLAK